MSIVSSGQLLPGSAEDTQSRRLGPGPEEAEAAERRERGDWVVARSMDYLGYKPLPTNLSHTQLA